MRYLDCRLTPEVLRLRSTGCPQLSAGNSTGAPSSRWYRAPRRRRDRLGCSDTLASLRGWSDVLVACYEVGARLFVDLAAERALELAEVSAGGVSTFVARHGPGAVKLAPGCRTILCAARDVNALMKRGPHGRGVRGKAATMVGSLENVACVVRLGWVGRRRLWSAPVAGEPLIDQAVAAAPALAAEQRGCAADRPDLGHRIARPAWRTRRSAGCFVPRTQPQRGTDRTTRGGHR